MKIVDANVLLYAVNRVDPNHAKLKQWLSDALTGSQPVGFAWITIVGFVRIATHPRIFTEPLTVDEALSQVDMWLAEANAQLVSESRDHWIQLSQFIQEAGTAGDITTDAHLAAIAISRGATVVSSDADFARFPHLRWENPLA